MRTRLFAALLSLLLLPSIALAEPSEFRVAGSYSFGPSGLNGELVPVFVPWDGVNNRGDILSCLTGPYSVSDRILTVEKPGRLVRIRLKGDLEADWELTESSGACAGLSGSGAYRITDTPMLRLTGNLDFAARPATPADEGREG
jgi:hypothetical protein